MYIRMPELFENTSIACRTIEINIECSINILELRSIRRISGKIHNATLPQHFVMPGTQQTGDQEAVVLNMQRVIAIVVFGENGNNLWH